MNKNSHGKIFYGIHFYPGVAEYRDPGVAPYRVFLNENTLRKMDPSFAGKPIYVNHVEEVEQDIDLLRGEVDGWVIQSFYNEADGKHWVKFIIVSEKGDEAVRQGMKLSNAYLPTQTSRGGLWNGVTYLKEIIDAEYEHLAIVDNPRYEESVIMTPDQFKKYNEEQVIELKRLSNSKQGEAKMKLNFFKKTRVENAIDPELQVVLPKSGRETTLISLINEADEKESDKNAGLADMSHKVKMDDGSYCNVGELLEKHKSMKDELESMKKVKEDEKEKELDLEVSEGDVDSESDKENVDEMHPEKEVHDDMDGMEDEMDEDEGTKKKGLKLDEESEKEVEDAKKKKNASEAKIKADRLRNAHLRAFQNEEAPVIELSADRVARGKVRYGS